MFQCYTIALALYYLSIRKVINNQYKLISTLNVILAAFPIVFTSALLMFLQRNFGAFYCVRTAVSGAEFVAVQNVYLLNVNVYKILLFCCINFVYTEK